MTDIKLEEGKCYETEGQGVLGPMVKRPDGTFAPEDWTSIGWDENGRDCDMDDCPWRIIAEWADAPETDIKAHIADTAKSIVSGARRSAYGTPEQNFERIAALWSGYATARGWSITFTAADVSPLMILMKLARLAETPDHLDSAVDLVGYTLTMAEVNGIKKDA